MKRITILTLFLAAGSVFAAPFQNGDPLAGKELFDKYKCSSCHIGKMGGDGSAIFTRPNHKATSPQLIIERMKMCSGSIGAILSVQEQEHLGAYLNQHYYKFK